MEQISKEGVPIKINFRTLQKIKDVYYYETLPFAFFSLLHFFKDNKLKNLKDEEVRKDIASTIDIITRFEKRARLKKNNQNYVGYLKRDVDRLREIMTKFPMQIGLDMANYRSARVKKIIKKGEHLLTQADADFLTAEARKKKRTEIKFFPFDTSGNYEFNVHEYLDEIACRRLLSFGIFMYLQEVIGGRGSKITTCKRCGRIFMHERCSRKFCSDKCKYGNWNKENRDKCKKKSKKCRDNPEKLPR